MERFNAYEEEKETLRKRLLVLRRKLSQLETLDIDCADDIKKIDNALKTLHDDKVLIVLVGAFSDGKTSIIAGWLNELKDDMIYEASPARHHFCNGLVCSRLTQLAAQSG